MVCNIIINSVAIAPPSLLPLAPVAAAAAASKKAAMNGQEGQSPKMGGSVPLTPADLSKFKSDRDRHKSQIELDQRQRHAASLALARVSYTWAMKGLGTQLQQSSVR